MQIEIRTCAPHEVEQFVRIAHVAFGEEAPRAEMPLFERVFERDRMLVAVDGGASDGGSIVGTAAAYSFAPTVPGGEARAAGVSWVGVLPTHRRRGILRSLMRRQLDDVRARGEPVAILFASEGTIYQRFGYGLATLSAAFEIDRAWTAFRPDQPPVGGTRLLTGDEVARMLPPIYEQVGRAQPGFFSRSPAWWEAEVIADPEGRRNGAGPKFFVVHEVDGEPDGYAIYRIRPAWSQGSASSTLVAREVVATTPLATRELWRYLFAVDLVQRIRGDMVVPDHPLLLQLAEPRRLALTIADGLWLRVVDLPAAMEARSYAAEGSLVLEVRDEFCPWNAGRWRLTATGPEEAKRATVVRTDEAPDLACEIGDLGAVYLGGVSFAQLGRALRAVELRPGALSRADALFRAERTPWCPQVF